MLHKIIPVSGAFQLRWKCFNTHVFLLTCACLLMSFFLLFSWHTGLILKENIMIQCLNVLMSCKKNVLLAVSLWLGDAEHNLTSKPWPPIRSSAVESAYATIALAAASAVVKFDLVTELQKINGVLSQYVEKTEARLSDDDALSTLIMRCVAQQCIIWACTDNGRGRNEA